LGATILTAILGSVIVLLVFLIIKSVVMPQGTVAMEKLLAQEKYQAAVKLGRNIVKKKPQDPEGHYFLGKALLGLNKDDLALAEFKFVNENAIFEQTGIVESQFRSEIAKLYLKFNLREEALKEYLLLIKLQPRNGEHYYHAGRLMEQHQRTDQAVNYYQTAIRLTPRLYQARVAMGQVFFRARQYHEAIREFKTAAELSLTDFSVHFWLGKAYRAAKDFTAALSAFEKAARAPKLRQAAFLERGGCCLGMNNPARAAGEFEKAIGAADDEKSEVTLLARYCLADCYEKTRKIAQAVDQWNMIFLVNRDFKNVAKKLAMYQSVQSNAGMKEYLESGKEQFYALCGSLTERSFSMDCKGVVPVQWGCRAAGVARDTGESALVYFLRDNEPVTEIVIRALADELKTGSAKRAIVCSSSGFESQAEVFAEGRPIELVDGEALNGLLLKAGTRA
jgi:tetratricopeptide (TPR) repeat protein